MLNDTDNYSASVLDESTHPAPEEIGYSDGLETSPSVVLGAVKKVVEKARDNRKPAPPMKAVSVEEASDEGEDWSLDDVLIGVEEATAGLESYPLTRDLIRRFNTDTKPRFVRVDTEASYEQFRAQNSPEMSELRERVDDLSSRLSQHESDPNAHQANLDDVEELTYFGQSVIQAERDKKVDLWLPERFKGLVKAWEEGDVVCASIVLPGSDGEVRICTSIEPIRKAIREMARHASEAGVPAATVVGLLPCMGAMLGAGTIVKEMAKAAPAILSRPEANSPKPFFVRIEPKINPNICALAALAQLCAKGNKKACDEWERLRSGSPVPIRQMMAEALQLLKKAATA